MNILVTGCFGFIGSNFVHHMLKKHKKIKIFGIDAMTYAARPDYLKKLLAKDKLEDRFNSTYCDITNETHVNFIIHSIKPDHLVHFAAESHVCRSFETPRKFLTTNVVGTYNLLDACKNTWKHLGEHRFHHVSTDEVFGELPLDEPDKKFHVEHPYAPRSPYSASKAASDHFVMAFHHSFGMDVTLSNCSNNFGENQDFEKLIPKTIKTIAQHKPPELYGAGTQIRDWLHVRDHCSAIETILFHSQSGKRYCIGGENELKNIELVHFIQKLIKKFGYESNEIIYSNKRPTDDLRYAIDNKEIRALGWKPRKNFDTLMTQTIKYYLENL